MKNDRDAAPSREWLRKMADLEDGSDSVLAGGLVQEFGMLRRPLVGQTPVFRRFVEFARRARGLSLEQLAAEADVDLAELVAIECDPGCRPTPRTVHQLAGVLHVSPAKLLVLCGLAETRDEKLGEAALRFAARSEPSASLSSEEQEAFEELVKVLADAPDRS